MPDRNVGDQQRRHWQRTFAAHPDMYGTQPSEPAQYAIELFTREHSARCWSSALGRDETRSPSCGEIWVTALDYAPDRYAGRGPGGTARAEGSAGQLAHDVREPIPWPDATLMPSIAHAVQHGAEHWPL